MRTFRLPGSRHVKSFCTTCGSALSFAVGNDGELVVPAGSLDSRAGMRPDAHICISSCADWDDEPRRVCGRLDDLSYAAMV
ncbi:GFA family protein [Oceaniglobus trochenteri]|uniref:GFA family protein n=1 Tax=Oceaniglobus trochenteri TaxID=2763260 RepID=UPI001CFFA479